jgi:hypothetical protein
MTSLQGPEEEKSSKSENYQPSMTYDQVPDFTILKYFCRKIGRKNGRFRLETTGFSAKNDHNIIKQNI